MSNSEDAPVSSAPESELKIIQFWKQNRIYEKSQELRKDAPPFVFFEGPPTANGLPHPGHCLTRSIKDLHPRYRTMRGYRVDRKAGWDTHGLPVEVEVCKELGIHSKEEIEKYGVEPFIMKCLESVFRYTKQWEELTERIGFWIRLDEAYVTYHQSFVESVWWSLKTLFEKGYLYEGHKIVWWWAQGGTALSSGEVGQGYRQVADSSVFVRFPLLDSHGTPTDTDLLVWTTTPWTLPSNQFAAVHPELEYAEVEFSDENGVIEPQKIIIAAVLVDQIAAKIKKTAKIVKTCTGSELIGMRYVPPFDCYYKKMGHLQGTLKTGKEEYLAWRIVGANFVTTDAGTGAVHEAPAFGEVDFDLLMEESKRFLDGQGPGLICAVASDGKFTEIVPEFQGRWVKDCDKELIRKLRENGSLFHQEQYLHDYPFCWRASQDPLIQYPRKSWFIKTSQFKNWMLANNQMIHWYPEHIQNGRFGNFLESNVDWALSRERYWGTPLPIWRCEETGYMEAVGSYEELSKKPGVKGQEVWFNAKKADPDLCDDLKVHKPYIDAVTYDSPKSPGKRMKRVPEVIDCWYDSGAMPFAQWGYPHKKGSQELFAEHFPADFISEALDQTRGWFYSLLAISTLLFFEGENLEDLNVAAKVNADDLKLDPILPVAFPHPYKNCMVLGLMLGEDGQKMSKSLRNYKEPKEIFDRYGADALRWYLFANQTPWTPIRYDEKSIRDSMPEFLLRLKNVWGFYKIYAEIDGFGPAKELSGSMEKEPLHDFQLTPQELDRAESYRPVFRRPELDRWILSELHTTSAAVVELMDKYDHYNACAKISAFVDAMSNWYVRRSRDRFWSGEATDSKKDAYWTLYESLITLTKLIAPFVPFLAEEIWQNLAVGNFGKGVRESVHLCDYPTADTSLMDEPLSQEMALVREIVSLGRNARVNARLKVRQPLQSVKIILVDSSKKEAMMRQAELIKQELNVKEVEFVEEAGKYITYTVLPDFKKLGPKLGKSLPEIKKVLQSADGGKLLHEMEKNGSVTLPVSGGNAVLSPDEVQIRLQAKEGWAAAHSPMCVLVLATELTESLLAEGRARELIRLIQDRRKEIGCEYTDRIHVAVVTQSGKIADAAKEFAGYIQGETLASELTFGPVSGIEPVRNTIDGEEVTLYVKR
ncbi:MAG: isoleucine--tRNA ligase [Planctomycetaceae bacterium]|jgi:isoleucyl-tRNA synthetase|nr:isoleucine--tRNA ligase [Planctomycetaceae bacterium]